MRDHGDRGAFEILYTEEEIDRRVQSLAGEINTAYDVDRPLHLIGVLTGGFVFLSDLVRELEMPVTVQFVETSSYGSDTAPDDRVRIDRDSVDSIEGEHVLLVEDIVDTGRTVNRLRELLSERSPRSLSICTMFFKPARYEQAFDPDFVGFEVPDRFVVGYGLDHDERYRELPFLAVSPDVDDH